MENKIAMCSASFKAHDGKTHIYHGLVPHVISKLEEEYNLLNPSECNSNLPTINVSIKFYYVPVFSDIESDLKLSKGGENNDPYENAHGM